MGVGDGAGFAPSVDGDLLLDVIAEACPDVMTREAARAVAERALTALAAAPGVTVLRGEFSDPWPQSRYPDTRSVTLCTLDGRRGGDVTVGESGVVAARVLGLLRSHGPAEAAGMWPQLDPDGLAVLERLSRDCQVDADDALRDEVEALREALGRLAWAVDDPDAASQEERRAALDAAWDLVADTAPEGDDISDDI